MKNRNMYKLCLDIVMLILMLLMYNKSIISLAFHEIGGIALFVLFVLHLILNRRWIAASTRRFFSKEMPRGVRVLYIVDILLLIDFALVLLGALFISKIVFSFSGGGSWKTIHYFASALAIILMGVHVGLHFSYIHFTLKKAIPLPGKIARPIGILLLCIALGFGVYSLSTTSFLQWLSMPFSGSYGQLSGKGQNAEHFYGDLPTDPGVLPDDGNGFMSELPSDFPNSQPQDNSAMPEPADGTNGMRKGNGMGDGTGRGQGGEGKHLGGFEGNASSASFAGILLHLAQWISSMIVFAAITYWIDRLLHIKRRHPADKAESTIISEDTAADPAADACAIVIQDESAEAQEEK